MAKQEQTYGGMTGTAADLGLGDQLAAQSKDEIERRKRLQRLGLVPGSPLSPGVQSLFGNQGIKA